MRFNFFNRKTKSTTNPNTKESDRDGVQIKVSRVNHRPFYDSEWEVEVSIKDETGNITRNMSTKITRDETETAEMLEKEVRAFGKAISFDNIRSLDERVKIFYD